MILGITFLALQYKLWIGEGSLRDWISLQHEVEVVSEDNDKLAARNHSLEADITELKSGDQALEEQARTELGMIKENETYYEFKE